MPTVYVRGFSLKNSLTDAEVLEYWQWIMADVIPAVQKVSGVRSVKIYSGAGALRADLRFVFEMDDAGVYERLLVDSEVRPLLGRVYGAWNLETSTQLFNREITPELIRALSGTG